MSLLLVFSGTPAFAIGGGSGGAPDGMMCLTPVLETSYLAVRLEIAATEALAGVRWYNNDAQAVFPKVLLANGQDLDAPSLDGALEVAALVPGESDAWSSLQLEEPIASSASGLYVVFQLPANVPRTGVGEGTGPGFGYRQESQAEPVYVSADGADWAKLNAGYRLLVDPIVVQREPGMAVLSAPGGSRPQSGGPPRPSGVTSVFPNPANPEVHIEFAVGVAGRVSLLVYDLRGREVKRLLSAEFSPGVYGIDWNGRDSQGQAVASGLYFVLLRDRTGQSSRPLTLVR
jgi:hypothetical protein